jgi:hypothetical protein
LFADFVALKEIVGGMCASEQTRIAGGSEAMLGSAEHSKAISMRSMTP